MFRITSCLPLSSARICKVPSLSVSILQYLSTRSRISPNTLSRQPTTELVQVFRIRSPLLRHRAIRYFATDATSPKTTPLPVESTKEQILALQAELFRKLTKADGLNPNEWTLIYVNKKADGNLWYLWSLLIIGSITSGILVMLSILRLAAGLYMNQATNRDIVLMASCAAIGLIVAIFINRWRRLTIFRMYQRKGDSVKGRGEKAKREYCIIWYSFWRRRKQFFYNHTETSGARAMRRYPSATFYARNRPWDVVSSDFFNTDDYFHARMPVDVEKPNK